MAEGHFLVALFGLRLLINYYEGIFDNQEVPSLIYEMLCDLNKKYPLC